MAALTGVTYSFTPELRDMDEQGNEYVFEAPPSEIQPAFEEWWNGVVAMVNAIEVEEAVTPTVTPTVTDGAAANIINLTLLLVVVVIAWF